jgi:hypothetical protein
LPSDRNNPRQRCSRVRAHNSVVIGGTGYSIADSRHPPSQSLIHYNSVGRLSIASFLR